MGTEVLRPQDLLVERFHVAPPAFHRRRNFPSSGNLTTLVVNRRPIYNKRTSPKPDKKKLNETKKVTHGGAAGEARRKDDRSMPQVTILRRGESLDSLSPATNGKSSKPRPADDLAVLGAGRIGPDSPLMMPKQIRLSSPPFADVYAGSACSLSPSPRSLPLPSFFNKRQQDESKISPIDDPATRDLRRLLRLE